MSLRHGQIRDDAERTLQNCIPVVPTLAIPLRPEQNGLQVRQAQTEIENQGAMLFKDLKGRASKVVFTEHIRIRVHDSSGGHIFPQPFVAAPTWCEVLLRMPDDHTPISPSLILASPTSLRGRDGFPADCRITRLQSRMYCWGCCTFSSMREISKSPAIFPIRYAGT